MSCGELQNSPNAKSVAPFTGAVTLTIDRNRAVLDRNWAIGTERSEGALVHGQPLRLEGTGMFFKNLDGAWKIRAALTKSGQRYEGSAIIESRDGMTKYRDCTVSVETAEIPSEPIATQSKVNPGLGAVPTATSGRESPVAQQKATQQKGLNAMVFACINDGGLTGARITFLNDGRFLESFFLKSDGKFVPFSWNVGTYAKSDDIFVRKNQLSATGVDVAWKTVSIEVEIRDRFIRQQDGKVKRQNVATLNSGKDIGPQGGAICDDKTSSSTIADAQDIIKTISSGVQQRNSLKVQSPTNSSQSETSIGLCTKPSDREEAKRQTLAAREAVIAAIAKAKHIGGLCNAFSRGSIEPMVSRADDGLNNLLNLYGSKSGPDASMWNAYCSQYFNGAKAFTGECR